MKKALEQIWNKVTGWYDDFINILPNLLMAIAVMFAFYFLARLVKNGLLKLVGRVSTDHAVIRLLANMATVAVMIIGLFVALDILHLDKTVTSILAGAGVMGLAVGLAFQDPILNVISGILLSVRTMPFKINDLVKTSGYYGRVHQITLRSTIIRTLDGIDVVIPNKTVLQNPIENITLTGNRRIDIACGVGYGSDLELVHKTAIAAIEPLERDTSKEIEVMFTEFGASSINFILRFWVKNSEEKYFLDSRSAGIIAIKKAFDQEGINIPFPIRTLEFKQKEVMEAISSANSATKSN